MGNLSHGLKLFFDQMQLGMQNFTAGLSGRAQLLAINPDMGGFVMNFSPLQFPAMLFRLRVTMPGKGKWRIENLNWFPYMDFYADDSNELKFLFLLPYQALDLSTHRFHLMVFGLGNTEM